MYVINKIVGFLIDPVNVAVIGVLAAVVLGRLRRRRVAVAALGAAVAWFWLWATPLMTGFVGAGLERPYLAGGRIPAIAGYSAADAIVLHGGSMCGNAQLGGDGEMWTSADRVWTAARLWKAGKASVVYVLGRGVRDSTRQLLLDFGVPTNALVFAESPRNTEEEAKFVAEAVKGRRVLVVTSAWHLTRTLQLYAKYAPRLEALPAPCDFENLLMAERTNFWAGLWPRAEALLLNRVALHERVGSWGYAVFRK